MILNKGNLQAIGIISKDKNTPILGNLLITKDGATISANRNILFAVSQLPEQYKKQLPITETEIHGDILINADTVNEIIKNIPKDTLFEGRLENCDIDDNATVKTHDGKQERIIHARKIMAKFIPFKELFKSIFSRKTENKVIANLSRLILALQAMQKISGDSSGELPVFIEFTSDNGMILRTINPITTQRIICTSTTYKGFKDKWMEYSVFENELADNKKKIIIKH